MVQLMVWNLKRKGFVQRLAAGLALTPSGKNAGKGMIRSHRLWETYLCDVMGYCDADAHRHAHRFEHFTDPDLRHRLSEATGNPDHDPHRRVIPEEEET
jgi:Mn-dependent DtxR family transcriptional regulator